MAKLQTAETETVETETVDQATGEVTATENTAEQTGTEAPAPGGVRVRRAFMLKQFLPNPDWINVNIVAKGKGTRAVVGRVFGIATGVERKVNTLPDGTPSESIVLKGTFQADGYVTGETGESSNVYLPMAYAEQVATIFAQGEVNTVEIDCDIGIEATGKTIPYEWVVIAFREGEQMDVLKRLRNSRGRPTNLLTGPGAAAITDQSQA